MKHNPARSKTDQATKAHSCNRIQLTGVQTGCSNTSYGEAICYNSQSRNPIKALLSRNTANERVMSAFVIFFGTKCKHHRTLNAGVDS